MIDTLRAWPLKPRKQTKNPTEMAFQNCMNCKNIAKIGNEGERMGKLFFTAERQISF